jgi:acyl carrier protein
MSIEMQQTISDFIVKTILKQPKRVIQPGDALISSGLIDSFSLVDLALFVEDTFGVRIADSELNASTFDSVEQLANLIEVRQKK